MLTNFISEKMLYKFVKIKWSNLKPTFDGSMFQSSLSRKLTGLGDGKKTDK